MLGLPAFARADEPPAPEGEESHVAVAPPLVPPRLIESKPPAYPPSQLASGLHPTVVVKLTVFADGTSGDVAIEHTAGDDFDAAALATIAAWRFAPATRDGTPIASRVSVAVHFELPELAVHEVSTLNAPAPAVAHEHERPPAVPAPEFEAAVEVRAPTRSEERGATDVRISGELLRAAPAADGGELLARAPGLTVARIEGDAVAQRIMLRGFDADHGQDVELNVDGVPVNQVSHIHGQGYADLRFVIPETVRSLRVTEGVYDPRQGDFAVAGTADLELGVERRGVRVASSYGSFDTFRELALYAPESQRPDTFGAALFQKTRGFGQNRASTSGAAVVQVGLGEKASRTVLHASVYGVRARTANVLRRDDVAAGRVGFYEVYPLATTEAQSGVAQRAQLSVHTRRLGARGENADFVAYALVQTFRLQANYTGFTEISREHPAWTGRGDLIEQLNASRTLGLKGRYRSGELGRGAWRGFVEAGVAGRFDSVDQAQNLLEAPENTTWDRRIDATIQALDVGAHVDAELRIFGRVRLRGGVRTDLLSYQVADALANFIPAFRKEDHIAGYRRSAAGLVFGPRAVLDVALHDALSVVAAYGEGYRSPMALLLDDGETAPFVKVRSADAGVRFTLGERLELRGSGYLTSLDDDVAFDPREGRASPVGPSRRLGAVFYGLAQPWPWLFGAVSVTYVHATLERPPASTAEEPNPPFQKGQLLPYVPPVVVRADLRAEHTLVELSGAPLRARAGAGFSYWSPRPLPFSERAAAVSLLDAELSASYGRVTATASCSNLLGTRYAALELVYASTFSPEGYLARVPARHIMAGAPRSWLISLEVSL